MNQTKRNVEIINRVMGFFFRNAVMSLEDWDNILLEVENEKEKSISSDR